MANVHIKRCSGSSVIREMRIKTTLRLLPFTYYDAVIKKTEYSKCCKDVEKLEPSYVAGGNGKWCSHCGRQFGSSSKSFIRIIWGKFKQNYHITQQLLSLSVYLKELKTDLNRYWYVSVHSSSKFPRASWWKQPRSLLTNEWINNMYIHTVEYYLAVERNELLIHAEM